LSLSKVNKAKPSPNRNQQEPQFSPQVGDRLNKSADSQEKEGDAVGDQVVKPTLNFFGEPAFFQPNPIIQAQLKAEAIQKKESEETDVQEKSEEPATTTSSTAETKLGGSATGEQEITSTLPSSGVFTLNGVECEYKPESTYTALYNLTYAQAMSLVKNPRIIYEGQSYSFNAFFQSVLNLKNGITKKLKAYLTDVDKISHFQIGNNYGTVLTSLFAVSDAEAPSKDPATKKGTTASSEPKVTKPNTAKQPGPKTESGVSAESATGKVPEKEVEPEKVIEPEKTPEPTEKTGIDEDKSGDTESDENSTGPYWKHEWHIDRFGNESVFIWEVGGTRYYANANRGYSYIREKASLLPSDTGYDPRFEKYKRRPQAHEGSDSKLNWWIKRTPGWDNPEHVDNGTADFQDLAEFKDASYNKKGSGFYYIGYVFDPLIYEKLEEQKRRTENQKYIGNVTNYVGYVSAEGGIILHDTPTPFDEAYQTKRSGENKDEFIIDFNQPITVIAEGNNENEGWVMIRNSIGEEGWIERRFISKKPEIKSDDNFDSYTVKSGDILEDLIESYYEKYPFATGNDKRTVALAIYLYNKDKPGSGVYRDPDKYKNAGSWKDTFDPWMKETRANYQSVELYTGGEVLLPPAEYINKMRQLGEVEKRPDFANVMIESGRLLQGFIAGIGIGFWDALKGAAEDLYNMVVDIFTGAIFDQLTEMFKTIMDLGLDGIWNAIKDFGTSTYEEVTAAWNNKNPYERGQYFGEIIGMILFEVVLALITYGAAAAIRNSARVSKIMKLFPSWTKKIDTPENRKKFGDIDKSKGDKDFEVDKKKSSDTDLKGPQKGTGTDSEMDDLAKKDKNERIDDDVKDTEADSDSKKAAMSQARNIVTAGDIASQHPSEIMPALWALTVFKGVRGFSFKGISADHFEIYMHGSKKRIKPKDGKYDIDGGKEGSIETPEEKKKRLEKKKTEVEEQKILEKLDDIKKQSFDERKQNLGNDIGKGYIEHEGDVGANIEAGYGYLERSPDNEVEWISLSGSDKGKTLDLIGLEPGVSEFVPDDMKKFISSLEDHFTKADIVILDYRFMNEVQISNVEKFLSSNGIIEGETLKKIWTDFE